MKTKLLPIFFTAVLALGGISCSRPYGARLYPDAPRFAKTRPENVELLRREPRRSHVRLGEVWVEPSPRWGRTHVEGILREKTADLGGNALVIVVDRYFREGAAFNYWRGPTAAYERRIVGIAIRFRR